MLIYALFCSLLALGYFFINLRYYWHWQRQREFSPAADFQPKTTIDVIIVARNEEKQILALLESLNEQNYPKNLYRISLIDDHSTDKTVILANHFLETNPQLQAQILPLSAAPFLDKDSQSFKKMGIHYALQNTQNELIVCTDADCIMGENWLRNYACAWQQTGAFFLSAGVLLSGENNLLGRFQQLDNVGMMAITAAGAKIGHFLANGANMAYPRFIYKQVGGYAQNYQYASGDDMFLAGKIGDKYPDKVFFIKNNLSTVQTEAKKTFAGFYQQRLRWATKSKGYQSKKMIFTLAIIWLSTVFILISLVLSLFLSKVWIILALQLGLKMLADWLLLRSAATFFGQKFLLKHFISCFFAHIVYISTVGLMANLVKKYEWKGRRVS